MPYDLAVNEFIENGPAAMAIRARSAHSTARVWRAMDLSSMLEAAHQPKVPRTTSSTVANARER